MITARHHVQLNGENYRLAEDAEGQHYVKAYPPQRSPNAVVVKGEEQGAQRFQTRPDVEVWNITDWSGGEGLIRFNPQAPNQHQLMQNVDGTSRPGMLQPAGTVAACEQVSGGGTITDDSYTLVACKGSLYALNRDLTGNTGLKWRRWSTTTNDWTALSAAVTSVPTTGVLNMSVDADEDNIYFTVNGGQVFRWVPEAASATAMTTGFSASPYADIAAIGDYVYIMGTTGVDEIAKTASAVAVTNMGTFSTTANDNFGQGNMAKGANRLYFMATYRSETVIYELVPSTASGTGFFSETLRLPGMYGTALFYLNGLLYIMGADNDDYTSRVILYWAPGQEFGSVGKVRDKAIEEIQALPLSGGRQGADLLTRAFVVGNASGTRLFQLDTLEGSIQQLGSNAVDIGILGAIVRFNGATFWTGHNAGIWWYDPTTPEITATTLFQTAWYDFGLAETKVLSSVRLTTEKWPANWQAKIYVDVGDLTWDLLGTVGTTNGTVFDLPVSVAGDTKQFSNLRLRVEFDGTGTSFPVIQNIELKAQIAEHSPTWQLLIDLADELTGGEAGAAKIANLETAADSGTVISFLDGAKNRLTGQYSTHNVIVDACSINLQRSGEGVAQVTLIEVA